MPDPKVSVAVVTYNHEPFIAETLDSILQQDYGDLEIVVSDDCSTDRTAEILLDYRSANPDRLRVLTSEENRGVIGNSNRVLAACRGEYIQWTDGDDLMLPGKLRKQTAVLDDDPRVAICFHDLEIFDSSSGQCLGYTNSGRHSLRPRQGGAENLVQYGCCMKASSIMGRHSTISEAGRDTRLRHGADWLLYIEMATRGSVRYIPEVLGRYRRHDGNITLRLDDMVHDNRLTLDIVEGRYPHLRPQVRCSRGLLVLHQGTDAIRAGETRRGLSLMAKAFAIGGPRLALYSLERIYMTRIAREAPR